MKFAARFLTLLATAAAVFTGCQQEEADYELPSIKIGGQFTVDEQTKKASFEAGKDLTVLNLSVTATRDWTAEIEWDADEVPWIAVTPEKGLASDAPQAVKVTILDNAGYNRAKQIKFSINYDYKTLYITQSGEKGEEIVGTLENPFTVAGAIKYVKTLGSDVQSPELMYVKGKISQIADAGTFTEGGTFGNATFYISEDGSTTSDQFYCYRILYLGNQKFQAGQTDIKVGDDVIVCGKLVNYKGNTPETVQGSAFLYELNGKSEGGAPGPSGDAKGSGTLEDPYNPVAASAAVANLTWTDKNTYDKTGDVYVKGKISRIASNGTFTEGGTFGNASFYISEDGTNSGEFYAFRILYLGNKKFQAGQTDIKVGDEVVICGKLMNYMGNTPETVAGEAYLYSLNGKSEGGSQGGGETTDVKAVTIAEFNAAPESQTQVYELVGTIGGSINTTYGNFDLTDDSGTVYVYGLTATNNGYGTKNDQSYASLGLKEGDKIKIQGYRGSYGDKIEVLYAWFIEKVTEGGGGETTDVKKVTVAEFNAAPESQTQVYELVGTIGGSINTTYGNFDLTDDSGTVYVYGLTATNNGYGTRNDQSYASLGLKEGDKIKIQGYRGSYGDKIEVLYAWFIEKVTEGGGGETTDVKKVTVAEFNAAPESQTQVYELVGTIGGSINTTYGNFDLTDDSGTVYVYGLTATNNGYGTRNDQSYASLGLKEGDKIKIQGYRGSYGDKIEVLYAWFIEKVTEGGGGGTTGSTISFDTNSGAETWAAETDGTYGVGFSTTTQGVKVGYYKHKSSSNAVAPNATEVRIYKNSALVITAPSGKTIKKMVITTAGTGSGQYCLDMTGLEGAANATADVSSLSVTWTGSASKVALQSEKGQVRMVKLTLELE